MTKELFVETYCHNCGSQRCEGIDTDWFDGCKYKWNLDEMDAATEIERLEKKIYELTNKIYKISEKEVEKIQGNCKICEYMREERFDYADQSILIPHCWGQKGMPKVLYTDTCKDFKKKVER